MSLDGEPGWVCLMSCNCDILFSALVIQWVTSKDNAGTSSANSPASSTPASTPLVPQVGTSTQSHTPNDLRTPRGGVIVTTTIESEIKPGSKSGPGQLNLGERRQNAYARAEEGRIDVDSSVHDGYCGSTTSITAGHFGSESTSSYRA
ncbi:hypothetical protein C2857_004391 [Epichloe festucae Fl1]|uniref:Uncharacterized protein n=1 Tax=Epichloe festucae (strain Fl1) TaxID=877507 RepID=A0A7S9KV06_EPIFF|nr:hypothetical protein C2857_004391 [Epichloe festucae Fl1]